VSDDHSKSLIEYPCHFPIKVMGQMRDDFKQVITNICQQFDSSFDFNTIEERLSKKGNYLGLTVNVYVKNREQLDEVYRTLSTHPYVSVVL